jgi:hypothetical protein
LNAGTSGKAPAIVTNAFGGWERLLRVDYAQETGREPLDVRSIESLNGLDRGFGGTVHGNIVEAPASAFHGSAEEDYHLAPGSRCVDAGTDARAMQASGAGASLTRVEIGSDRDGKPRPATRPLVSPGPPRGWDIGAYELSD